MRCTSPKTVGFLADGKTLTWSQKHYSKEYSTFQLPCGKCLSCRLEYSRQWAVRCMHEAQMYENNCFITLTYDENNLTSKLVYKDFQTFVKNLRSHIHQKTLDTLYPNDLNNREAQRKKFNQLSKETKKAIQNERQISIFTTGEYGDKTKRPHWHACIFNWRPTDLTYKYSNDRGDKVYSSETLTNLWKKGICEFGSVTYDSAGYCARYAAKKLVHGKDQDHDFQPISKKSSKNAIGKKFLESFWQDIFNTGRVTLPNGQSCSIPRYYEKWLKNNRPADYEKYITKLKAERSAEIIKKEEEIKQEEIEENLKRTFEEGLLITRNKVREVILEQKFNQLQQNNKF